MDWEPISSRLFREALGHFASGVTVVAARTASGLVGFTATGFSSVSLTPPLVLVCVGRHASVHEGIIGAEHFGVSVLSDRQGWIAEQFACSGIDRFHNVALRPGRVPAIDGALARLECRRHALFDAGDHTIVVGEVLAGSVAPGKPLVHFSRHLGWVVAEAAPRATSEAGTTSESATVR
jgi:flavin reductase (DIM6/NTAB) family NADH-FMN oxidoreductase RutF